MKNFTDLDKSYSISAEQINFFKKKGYIKLKDVLSTETLNHYGAIITDLVKKYNKQSKPLEERDTYHKAFLQITNLWTKEETAKVFAFSRRLAQIASDLLETNGVRMYHDQALYKEPGGGFTPWHADQQYWPLATDKCATVWIPFQKTPVNMGPLAFAEGSHQTTFARNIAISEQSEEVIQKKVDELNLPYNFSGYDLGEVSYHYGWTLHRAGGNSTQKPRAVMTMIYMDKEMRLAEPANDNQKVDWEVFCPGVKPGEIIDTQLNPVLFSRD